MLFFFTEKSNVKKDRNHGKAERKWKLWKEKEEKILRDSGVSEDIIEAIRLYDRQAFNSDRRYYDRAQETGTYLDTVAAVSYTHLYPKLLCTSFQMQDMNSINMHQTRSVSYTHLDVYKRQGFRHPGGFCEPAPRRGL